MARCVEEAVSRAETASRRADPDQTKGPEAAFKEQ